MNSTSGIMADPSMRQLEFLEYIPSVMNFEVEMDHPDVDALEKAVSFFVKRHESIRTIFPFVHGERKQLVLPHDDKRFAITHIDISGQDVSYRDLRSRYYKKTEAQFANKKKGPLARFFLFRIAEHQYVFFLLIDHIVCDGWSMGKIIGEELNMFYRQYSAGKEPAVPPLKMQLRDYCERQKKWLRNNREALSLFWKTKLAGYDDRFDINSFYTGYLQRNPDAYATRANNPANTARKFLKLYGYPVSTMYSFRIPGERFQRIKRMADLNKCTMSAIVYAAFYIMLYCYTGRKKLLLAAFIADRFDRASQSIIGLLVGTVYLPREMSDQVTVRSFIEDILYETLTGCQNIIFSHEYIGLDDKKLNKRFDVLVNYIKGTVMPPQMEEQCGRHFETPGSSYFLESMIYEYDEDFMFFWKYKRAFDKKLIEDMAGCYNDILDLICASNNSTIGEVKKRYTGHSLAATALAV